MGREPSGRMDRILIENQAESLPATDSTEMAKETENRPLSPYERIPDGEKKAEPV